jgi:hypothetical protein
MFLNFCEERRALIQSALLTWLRELWEDFATCGERVEPEKRLANPDTADHIRDLDYPPQIEDAFLRISMCPRVSGSPVSRKNGAALAFTVREKKGAKAFQMVAVAVPPQIEIEDRVGRERLDLLRDILVKNGVARMPDNPQRWVLHCEPEHEQTTARILDLFVAHLT